ncbi:MAG TPA: DUF1801 domain-containing protein [Rudaea sp.]|jgi:hypothetical protein
MTTASVEKQIASFLGKYTPQLAAALEASRARLRGAFPRGFELVYDNYNALVFGFSPTDRASGAIVSIAGYPRWVTLFFLDGARLPDPRSLLEGNGKQVRGITLDAPDELDTAAVKALLRHALAPHAAAFAAAPPLTTVVKSVSEKQRPRRPADKPTTSAPNRSPGLPERKRNVSAVKQA